MELPELIKVDDAAVALALSKAVVERLIKSGRLPIYKFGEPNKKGVAVRIDKKDLKKLLESCKIQ